METLRWTQNPITPPKQCSVRVDHTAEHSLLLVCALQEAEGRGKEEIEGKDAASWQVVGRDQSNLSHLGL